MVMEKLLKLCIYMLMCGHGEIAEAVHTVFPRSVAAATINFSFTEVRRLFEGGVYSARRAGLPPSRAPSTFNFVLGLSALTPARVMADELAQFSFLLLLQSRAIAVTVLYYTIARLQRDRDSLFTSAHAHCNCSYDKCGYCSRAATIMLSPRSLRHLFEGGVYSRKYGIHTDLWSWRNC